MLSDALKKRFKKHFARFNASDFWQTMANILINKLLDCANVGRTALNQAIKSWCRPNIVLPALL